MTSITTSQFAKSVDVAVVAGAVVAVGVAAARCDGDEERSGEASRRALPQDLHSETRLCQVRDLPASDTHDAYESSV